MRKINCIVVDDEPLAIDVLKNYIEKVESLNLIGTSTNALEATGLIHNNDIDLVFLDIQMPEITGIEFVKSMNNPPAVVFTTAYSEFAVEGFNLNAVDYLLKPFSFDRFLKAVNKVLDAAKETTTTEVSAEDYIFVKTDKKIQKVKYSDIYYIEGLKDYVMIYTDSGRLITLMTMKSLEEQLPSNLFQRVHKSFIIGIDKIVSIMGNSIEVKDKYIPIGKMYKEPFFQIVEKHNLVK